MSCKIILNNVGGYYTPGSEVTGTVECNFTESTTLRSVKIRLKCREHIGWPSGKSSFDKDNVILRKEQSLLVSDPPMEHTGVQVFPFSFILPYELPTSFRSDLGYVEYTLKATIDVPLWVDPTDSLTLLIQSPIRFNTCAADYPGQTVQCMEKTLGFWCFRSGNLAMDIELPTTAFVLGETVNFRVNVQNLTSSNVNFLKIALIQTITYGPPRVSSKTREAKSKLLAFTNSGVGAHGERSYDLSFTIPQLSQILNFNGSTLIEVNYYIKASCNFFFNFQKFDIKVPIRLGYSRCDVRTTNYFGKIVNLPRPFTYVLFFPIS